MRRIAVYLFYDPQGQVDEYIPRKLRSLREHVEHIFVVSNSALQPEGRAILDEVADTVFVRENVGFDVWAYKEALERIGWERLAEYDELILLNYTFFGPIFPWSETFARMDPLDVDFWGLTAHGAVDPNPFAGQTGILPMHIQSHWLAVRKTMITSLEFRTYWSEMPMITSYDDSIMKHEARFTGHFARAGFRYAVAFPPADYPSTNPVFDNADLMLEARLPILKRRVFFHEPSYLDHQAIIGRRILAKVEAAGYPCDLIWRNVVRSAEPRTLYTNFSLLEVLDERDDGWRPDPAPRIAVLAHIYYEDMVEEMMSFIGNIPVPYDLIVTTPTEAKRAVILAALQQYPLGRVDVRVVDNRGRDQGALLVGCRDILCGDDYDLVCRVHSKKSPQDDYNAASLFKAHMFDNLLVSPGYVANVLRLFAEHDTLGMVFPPVVNIGYPTLGHAWFSNRAPAQALAKELGIHTLFDKDTPLAPYGSMFWCRPQALRTMAEHGWQSSDYDSQPGGYGDGSLTHVQERLMSYVALDAGYHVRCVINRDWAAINYTFLEYKLQRVSAMLPYRTQEQVDYLTRVQTGQPALALLKRFVDERYPRLSGALRPGYRTARAVSRLTRGRS